MTDIASLGLEINTSQVTQGASEMDKLTESAKRVDDAVSNIKPSVDGATSAIDQLGQASERTGAAVRTNNGQMNDTAEIMRRSAEAARILEASNNAFLQSLQREIDTFGMAQAELARYMAAEQGLSKAAQDRASILGATIDAMRRDEQAMRDMVAAQDKATAAADAFIKKLQDQVATQNLSTKEMLAYRAAQLGVADAAGPLIAQIKGAGGHMDGFSLSSARARSEIIVLAHELSQGNFQKFGSSMMVLGESTGAAGLLFSATGIAALGLATAVAGVSYAVVKGAQDQKAMNDALVMTGDYAGVTSDRLNEMAHAAVTAGGSISEAKKVATELAASGKFSGEQISYITEATVAWEHATGRSVDQIIKDFESLTVEGYGSSARATEMVSKNALKLDETYHFLTEAIYEQIRALEKEGDAKAASALATETFAKTMHDRSEEIIANAGSIARAWNEVKEVIGAVADGLGNIGKRATPGSEVERNSLRLKYFDDEVTASNLRLGRAPDAMNAAQEQARLGIVMDLTRAVEAKNKADAEAIAQAQVIRTQQEGAHAASQILQQDQMLEKKNWSQLDLDIRAYGEYLAKVQAANANSPLLSQDAVNEHMAALIKAHTKPQTGQDDRAKLLQDALQNEQAALDSERRIYESRSKMLDEYHKKFGTSDDEYYAGRDAARADYIAAEALTYAKETALVQSSLAQAKNPAEVAAAKGKYDQLVAAHNKFLDDMRTTGGQDRADDLANQKKIEDDYINSLSKSGESVLKSLDEQIVKEKQHGAEIGLTKAQVDALRQSQQDAATADLQNQAAAVAGLLQQQDLNAEAVEIYSVVLDQLQQQIEARRQLARVLHDNAVAQADADAARAASAAWDSTAQHVERTLADAIANGGGNAWKRLKTQIVSQALSVPLQFVGSTIASALNPGAPQAAGSNLFSTASGAASMFNAGKSLASGATLTSTVGNGITSVGSYLGSTTLSEFGAGFSGTASAESLAATLAGDVAPSLSAAASAGASLASALSTAVPYVAAAVVAYKLFDSVFGSGKESDTRLTFTSNNTPGNISINERGNEGKNDAYIAGASETSSLGTFGVSSTFWAPAESQTVQDFVKTVGLADDALAKYMTTQEKASVSSYLTGKTDTAHVGGEGDITGQTASQALSKVFTDRIKDILDGVEPGLSKLEDGFQGTTSELASEAASLLAYRAALKESGQAVFGMQVTLQDVAALKQPTEATSAALTRITDEFTATNQVAQMLGKDMSTAFGAAGLASESARAQIILLSGGLSTFTSQASSFAQNYLTSAEQLAPVSKALDAQLAALGLTTIPKTKDEFKNLVEGLDLSKESGQKLYAGLMALQDAFAQVHASEKSAEDVLNERTDLQNQLDQLTMSSTQLLAKQRNALDASNQALFDQVQAAQKSAAVLTERNGLQDQLDQLTMTSTQLAEKQRAALDSSNQALFDQVHMAQHASDVQKERAGLQTQLDQLTLSSSELLQQQRDALDESNRSLFDQVQAAQAASEAAKSSAAAQAAAAAALAQAQASSVAAMHSLGSSLAAAMDSAKAAADAFRSLNDALAFGDQSTLSPESKYLAAKQHYETASGTGLQSAEQDFLTASKAVHGNSFEYARDFADVYLRNSNGAAASDAAATAIPQMWRSLLGSGTIGAHANGGVASGWSLVGEQGPELAHFGQPARIYTASQTREMMGGSSDAAVRENTAVLNKVLSAIQENTKHTRKTADIWTRVTRDGNSLLTSAA